VDSQLVLVQTVNGNQLRLAKTESQQLQYSMARHSLAPTWTLLADTCSTHLLYKVSCIEMTSDTQFNTTQH